MEERVETVEELIEVLKKENPKDKIRVRVGYGSRQNTYVRNKGNNGYHYDGFIVIVGSDF